MASADLQHAYQALGHGGLTALHLQGRAKNSSEGVAGPVAVLRAEAKAKLGAEMQGYPMIVPYLTR